mgnify:FL=1
MAATGRLPRLDVFGDDYDTPDGTCIRDYIHVRDLAEAHVAAVRYLLSGGGSVSLNLGMGRGVSVRQILRAVEQKLKVAVPVDVLPRRPGDPAILIADPSRAKRIINFQPQLSDLETILESAVRSMPPQPLP